MCAELPAAFRAIHEYESMMGNIERGVLAPLRELPIEGAAINDLAVADVDLAAVSLVGSLPWWP